MGLKYKLDFVTNSSSTSFIFNVLAEELTAEVLVARLFADQGFIDEYKDLGFDEQESNSITSIIKSLNEYYEFPLSKGRYEMIFGDEEGTVAGRVFDYCLREGFSFEEVDISYNESLR